MAVRWLQPGCMSFKEPNQNFDLAYGEVRERLIDEKSMLETLEEMVSVFLKIELKYKKPEAL